ncbi:hypothetical protein SELMODRAFT_177305 [Selaginella moellendorffii]|uniref:Haem-binding uptake Tiki superfamily ChaN domain-containing protein n=1 Tax=Selaginella moellendorffii TaxID=88036 RepID=D8S6S6_SELML|nr:protein RETICULATA-RELATED 5, chloroplastic [Selaginella moellendorffii]EFJ19988.1 hypothetical protein SELMODRAFT_177305 [Selaginella moellendorffii]|eukprot:XP_002979031.1 protein RETICULATA-RELATED 5, chloroplastic [Selaginella moellendorffii]
MALALSASSAASVLHPRELSGHRSSFWIAVRYTRIASRLVARCSRDESCQGDGGGFQFQPTRRILLGASLLLPLTLQNQGAGAVENAPAGTSGKEKRKLWSLGEEDKAAESRVYDSLVLGEPVAIASNRDRVWQKLLASRVVYLGEAERVPDPDDKVLELEVVRALRDRCFEQQRPVTLAIEAFPCLLQGSLNQFMNKSSDSADLKAQVLDWPEGRWEQYQPLLEYCRDNGVRLMACGAPPEVLRTVQTKGIQGLSVGDRKRYSPPIKRGSALSYEIFQQSLQPDVLANASVPFGPGPYRFAQARIVQDHTMAQVVRQALVDSGTVGLVVVITGASHVQYGAKGSGLPSRIAPILPKKTQAVILLNPERQHIRKEGELPQADFLWYSAAKVCVRNCFDRAEVARVMSAAGRRREALPQDLQAGLERGVISPELLQSFLDLDKHPVLAELTKRFQGLRERLLADPRFLHRLAIEESISITTTLIAQYERRKDRFWKELDYVITDTVRGSVVDFFTVWLPAPRLAFRVFNDESAVGGLEGFLGSIPDNAFQRAHTGTNWDPSTRFLAVVLGGVKLFSVGFISSVGTLSLTNAYLDLRRKLNPELAPRVTNKRSPIFKTAAVYATFLGLSANLRYQIVAGVVEHWIADYFLASTPLAGNILSFLARTANSYWGTQQWVDLARIFGLQAHKAEGNTPECSEPSQNLDAIPVETKDGIGGEILPNSKN